MHSAKIESFPVVLSASRTNKQTMNLTLTKEVAAERIQMWWREHGGWHVWVRERAGGLWEHLAGPYTSCAPVADPGEAVVGHATMRPDSVPISERDSDPYIMDNVLPAIPDAEVVWRRIRVGRYGNSQ